MSAEEAVTVREMAAILGVHAQTLYQMINANRVPHIRVGEKAWGIRCYPSKVKAALEAQPEDPWARKGRRRTRAA